MAIDGGKDYLKRIGNEEDYEELSEIKDNQIRYILLRMSKRIVQDIDEYDGSCFDV